MFINYTSETPFYIVNEPYIVPIYHIWPTLVNKYDGYIFASSSIQLILKYKRIVTEAISPSCWPSTPQYGQFHSSSTCDLFSGLTPAYTHLLVDAIHRMLHSVVYKTATHLETCCLVAEHVYKL